MYSIEILRHINELESLVPEWDDLCRADTSATPFQTSTWAIAWWRHLGRGALHCVAVRYNGAMVGLAPLYVSRPIPALRRLALLGTGKSDYLDMLVHPEHRSEVAGRLYTALRHPRGAWDYIDLQQAPPGGHTLGLAGAAPKAFQVHPHSACPFLPLSGDAGMEHVPRSQRKNLRYSLGRLSRSCEVRFRLADKSSLEADLETLFCLHQSRWRSKGLPGVFGSGKVQAFHRDTSARLLNQGVLQLHFLENDRTTLAAALCYVLHGRAYYYGGGFDPAAAAFSPGSLIVGEAIRSAAAEGCREFDFLRGEEAYKRLWGCRIRRNHRIIGASSKVVSILVDRLPPCETRLEQLGLRLLEFYQHRRR